MNTTDSKLGAAIAAITHEEAKVIFERLCMKAKRTHSHDGAEANTRFSAVCSLRNEWDFGQGFPLADLKHLPLSERIDFLALLGLITTADYYPSFFERVIDETLGEL